MEAEYVTEPTAKVTRASLGRLEMAVGVAFVLGLLATGWAIYWTGWWYWLPIFVGGAFLLGVVVVTDWGDTDTSLADAVDAGVHPDLTTWRGRLDNWAPCLLGAVYTLALPSALILGLSALWAESRSDEFSVRPVALPSGPGSVLDLVIRPGGDIVALRLYQGGSPKQQWTSDGFLIDLRSASGIERTVSSTGLRGEPCAQGKQLCIHSLWSLPASLADSAPWTGVLWGAVRLPDTGETFAIETPVRLRAADGPHSSFSEQDGAWRMFWFVFAGVWAMDALLLIPLAMAARES